MALDNVPTWMSTRPCTLKWSTVPRPLRPRTPEACASSTIMMAPYFSARSHKRGQRADVAVHGKDAVGDEQLAAGLVLDAGELLLGVRDVFMAEDLDLGPGQTRAVDDGGVVQLVGDDEVVFAQHG